MKKLNRKGKVHPSPPPPTIAGYLSLLPATIFSLTALLSLQDKEVLAYLISCCSISPATTSNNFPGHQESTSKSRNDLNGDNKEHDPTFKCNCFRCYMCFWARWDSSPNRQLIHEIIEAYEEGLFQGKKQVMKNKKERRKRVSIHDSKHGNDQGSSGKGSVNLNEQLEFAEMNCQSGEEGEVEPERGSIRKIVSFIGNSIWGVWNRNQLSLH
ncbi:hypothetical protein CRYUN_Cryun14cG0146800 [Craigia yunnanensis]